MHDRLDPGVTGTTLRIAMSLCVFIVVAICSSFSSKAQDVASMPGFATWLGDFDGMEKRRLVRILVPYSKTIYFIDRGQQFGTAVELGRALEETLNKGKKKEIERFRIAFVPMARDRLLPSLVAGGGDIVAANLTVTPSRQEIVDFTAPLARGVKEILVTGPSAPSISTLDDLGGKEVFVRRSSSYFEHLEALNNMLAQTGKPKIDIRMIDESLEDEDLLEMVNAGLLPWCVVDDHKARIWSTVFENTKLQENLAISEDGEIAWAIRKDSPKLRTLLDAFVRDHRIGTTFGNMLKRRYYQSNKMLRAAHEGSEIEKFRVLRVYFQKHGATYNFDSLLLSAQGYQESRLNQNERSPRGAVGIMQLLPSTAADKSVAIDGIDESADRNIEAGAKYLRHLSTVYLDEPQLDPFDQALFAFAAYNAGPGNLRKFRRTASEMGLDPNKWFDNVEHGAAQVVGRETVQYVGNIYKYYVAYSLYEAREQHRSGSREKAAQ